MRNTTPSNITDDNNNTNKKTPKTPLKNSTNNSFKYKNEKRNKNK